LEKLVFMYRGRNAMPVHTGQDIWEMTTDVRFGQDSWEMSVWTGRPGR
jgi:hypothetical protein